jgi:uncharacterized membrane protein
MPAQTDDSAERQRADRRRHRIACALLVALIAWILARELLIAPLRPGGSLLALKALPFVAALPAVLRGRLYTVQWTALLVLVYIALGVVSGMSDALVRSRAAGWTEAGIATAYFFAALTYVRPYKQAHKARLRATEVAAAEVTEHEAP